MKQIYNDSVHLKQQKYVHITLLNLVVYARCFHIDVCTQLTSPNYQLVSP